MALRPDVLRYQRDFDRLYKKGRSAGEKYVVVFHIKNGLPDTRKAFLASKKVGGAVARNRARRLMKESFRKLEKEIAPGKDVLFIARNTMAGPGVKCADVEASMRKALKKSGLLT
jgi:ribonuclease P protein component